MSPVFRIGIDLGTTNCALAATEAASPDGHTSILAIPQEETAHSTASHDTLPSFLYLPPGAAPSRWSVGRHARIRAAEVPGRVISSAKSWLVHHAADRRAQFLPLGSDDIPVADQLSPVGALATLLKALAAAWDEAHPGSPLAAQDVAITVPASFDPAAQQLTLEAAREAGFPASTLLLEEPQAAFYAWMENAHAVFESLASRPEKSHVLVVDIGGGTTDLSLFSVAPQPGAPLPRLHRIAVSDHLLLGGDNLDLALAHFLEEKLAPHSQLPAATFAQLLARCRDIKEECLGATQPPDHTWPVAVAKPGASLLAGTLRTEISAEDISLLLLEGFFPFVGASERPLRATPGLREMGLPYAKDPAATRHLADFLRERPPVDFILFNGGLTKAPSVRHRILENIARWQPDHPPQILENSEPDLAVARGAARFLHLRATGDASRIEAGASHSYYIGIGEHNALCVLPQDAPPEKPHLTAPPSLRALVGKPVSFEILRNARRPADHPGDIISRDSEGFSELPALETILSPPAGARTPRDPNVHVKLRTTLRSTGLLRVELLCAEPSLRWDSPWPLEFSLRGHTTRSPGPSSPGRAAPKPPATDSVSLAAAQLATLLSPQRQSRQKLTANTIFSTGEKAIGIQKSLWTGGIVRHFFDSWLAAAPHRLATAEHEETWLHLAGWLLRPGCGMTGDPARATALADILTTAPKFPNGAVKTQRWIAARRIAAGLDATQSAAIWNAAAATWRDGTHPSAEIALLAGALESLPATTRSTLARRLATSLQAQPTNPAYWKALGRLLSRSLFHAGAEQILPPVLVEDLWFLLSDTDPGESLRPEAAACWLRAARLTGLRPVDVPKTTRNQIDAALRHWDIPEVRRRVLHEAVPLATADQAGLLGEAPPPGLSLASA
jgi:molecular chaperone DnaK (HSP70)